MAESYLEVEHSHAAGEKKLDRYLEILHTLRTEYSTDTPVGLAKTNEKNKHRTNWFNDVSVCLQKMEGFIKDAGLLKDIESFKQLIHTKVDWMAPRKKEEIDSADEIIDKVLAYF